GAVLSGDVTARRRWTYDTGAPDGAQSSNGSTRGRDDRDQTPASRRVRSGGATSGRRIRCCPETALVGARFALQLQEERLVPDVRRNGHHLGIAEAHELGVHHQITDPNVCEEPSVLVPPPHVQLEPHVLAVYEAPVQRGGFGPSRLCPSDQVMDLRGVNADVANLLHTRTALDVNGVAID